VHLAGPPLLGVRLERDTPSARIHVFAPDHARGDLIQPPLPDVKVPADLLPLSHLELDLPAPVESWAAHLAGRNIEITLDDIGRMSISREDARLLIAEQREAEVRRREKVAELERQAVEADQRRRAQIYAGIPVAAIPADVHPARAMLEASRDARRPRRMSPLQEALSGEGMTFHPIQHNADE
jgi:hypothetical protein